jgi:hypothetical protein
MLQAASEEVTKDCDSRACFVHLLSSRLMRLLFQPDEHGVHRADRLAAVGLRLMPEGRAAARLLFRGLAIL